MSKPKILVQLDTDSHTNVFDSVVAVDSGVDQLFRHHDVTPEAVEGLVHGAMFTRGPDELHNTAVFVGGSDVGAAERLAKAVGNCFFGPMRVSVMLDPSGANTTAAAAVIAAARHFDLQGAIALVLAATGPVGRRVVRLLARQGANVRVGSRSKLRSEAVCGDIKPDVNGSNITPHETGTNEGLAAALSGVDVLIAAGATGAALLSADDRRACRSLRVAIDLSAVPPAGLEGIEVVDKSVERDGAICYGAVGVGGTKMKIHKAAIRRLFESNDAVLDVDEIYELGEALG